ncbi:MAG: Uncharacterized protein conserved in bacteria [uncultured Sphingomonas sp.]|uniref:Uncharacterized protein conserved in bacteria n=1 Tax=uncultured Sphingomonas sp. TaxID=158754 RepID=A0A6J4SSM8_9SPHN|nr:MAG: Uncharacterized protein conserved in bacteria [uncultured Sphingomonas sp.]
MGVDPLIVPIVVLVAWTLCVMFWMAATRFGAMRRHGVRLKGARGGRGQNLEGVLPDEVSWKAHNYQHLMEQPTIFYAIVICLVLMGASMPINWALAWGYVIFRILHSIWQSTVNIVAVRFGLFLLSSFCLLGLTVHALAFILNARI